jgi:ubiquinone/menaquinone biosynthesis C-methylase UbiE
MAAHYDDPNFFYPCYWQNRQYEHEAEIIALEYLLQNRHFAHLADIGGGYGRLIPTLDQYADHLTLVEPSAKQRQTATTHLAYIRQLKILSGTAQKTKLPTSSQDAVVLVRVMHHLPDPTPTLAEAYRILKPGGFLILEFANSHHFKARLKSLLTGKPLPTTPLERRSKRNIQMHTIDFVNHHPQTILNTLTNQRFNILSILSVSNLRSSFLKKLIPLPLLLILESSIQRLASYIYFGPSIFILAQKS